MNTSETSVILGNGAQLDLIDADDVGLPARAYAVAESAGRFTGDRIFSTNPKLYWVIVKLLARAVPYREISDLCSVSVNTVCGVAAREGIPIETLRERIARLGLDVAALTLEAVRDILADPAMRLKLTAKDLMICHGIAFSNAQLASGGATSRLEHTAPGKPGHEDYEAFVREAVNVTPTGSTDPAPEQKKALPAPADAGSTLQAPSSTTPADEPANRPKTPNS